MKLSTKGQYGLKAMIALGVYAKDDYITLKEIATNVDVSDNYLEQLIALLRKAGYVKSRRGAQGGYKLSIDPKDISVGQILRALEGSLAPTSCSCEDNTAQCTNHDRCITQEVWIKIRDGINDVVDSIMLETLVNDYEQANIKE
ncbi:MAG TPA: Rrf2 family transcriptional regulator [Epulopiscium sp.]|nr:Rrf2 family transcriptional regulator [Candidatus Epulonipiscium sp.]